MNYPYIVISFITVIDIVIAPVPGSFFWKPRVGLDLSYPSTVGSGRRTTRRPTKAAQATGQAVYIDGYQIAITIVALAEAVGEGKMHPHLNILRAPFYTNAYRWGWRHFRLVYEWAGGKIPAYQNTHRVWVNRELYGRDFVPKWLRPLLVYVEPEEWSVEEEDLKLYEDNAAEAFAKPLLRL